MQWLQDPNQSNLDNLNDARQEASRHFRNKKREYLRGINDFKKGYQPRTNIVKIEKGDLVVDCYSILTRRSNYFFQLLNIHGNSDVRQTEIRTAELLVL